MANNVDYSKNSPNYTGNASVRGAFGYPRSIDTITIHWWGDPNTNPTYEGVVAWLCNPRSQASAHDIITGTGNRVAVIVDYVDAAWHAGNAKGNATSLGFECDPRCRNEDYEAVAQDVAETWRYYGREIPLVPHNSWKATQCPGNYDLGRIAARARQINAPAPVTPTQPTPPAIKEVKRDVYNPLKKFVFTQDCILEGIPNGGDAGNGKVFKANELVDIKQKLTMSDGSVWYRTQYSSDKELAQGFRSANVKEYVEAPAVAEWIRNLKDITDVKLSVLPAGGARVINLVTLEPLKDVLIAKGTQVDIAKETTVGGVKFLISSYSANGNIANGILASDLGTPVTPPVEEKPEWLKNLQDIEDKDFWTRSETPVLDIVNGNVLRRLPINTKVRVTHATEIIGKDLLVLEGSKEVIETVYLSDTEIKNPNDDLEQRVSVLEKIVASVVQFLSNLFKNFKP